MPARCAEYPVPTAGRVPIARIDLDASVTFVRSPRRPSPTKREQPAVQAHPTVAPPVERRRRILENAATAVLAAVWVLTVLVTLRTNASSPTSGDERYHHLPAIHQIASQFPDVEWRQLPLATGFAYHALLAGLVGAGVSDSGLRLVNAVFVAAAVLIIAVEARRAGGMLAPLFMLAMFVDAYIIGAARWIGSEGGYFVLTATVLVAICRGRSSLTSHGGTALTAGMVCLVRQTGLFLSLTIAAVDWLVDRAKARQAVTSALVALVPGVAALALLYLAYGGPTPEGVYRTTNVNLSLTPMAFVPASGALVFAIIAVVVPRVRRQLAGMPFLFGCLVGLAVPSSPGYGRVQSPIWLLARHAPVIAGRSVVVIVLAAVGVGCITALVRSLWELREHRTGTMVAVAVIMLAVVHLPSGQMYARYFEPVLLLVALLALTRQPERAWVARSLLVLILAGTLQSWLLLHGAITAIG
jgi:hypothetical protein